MLILGLLLLACIAAFTGLALADNVSGGPDYHVTILGNHIATMNSLAIFCAGLGLALLFGLSAMLAMTGLAMHRRKSHMLHSARRDAAVNARERDSLAARVDDDRRTTGEGAGDRGYAGATGSARADKPRRHHTPHLFGH
ncbi:MULTISPECIES: hypothetical protein [unclassified Streptomyces]|uniref:hypothetical protein n=1 Tax=unclassified Streptomyces TaxID=2593676 RepID=UPI002E2A8E15|nr:hypothetical protein [Streptomyces sp. NBC_00223]